jgi:integrase/recombinase XerD
MANINKSYFISIYLDKRRVKQNNKYPVRLRVFTPHPRRQKLYTTSYEFTPAEYKAIWEVEKPRKIEHRAIKQKLQALEVKAYEVANQLSIFSFEEFDRILYGGRGAELLDVNYYYEKAIAQYQQNDKLGTASNYDLSLKSLLIFHGKERLAFHTITPQWLRDYEKFMIEVKGRSKTTVGIYLRPLRAIFNTAIAEKTISQDLYPFGKRKYVIPAPKGVKKALSKEELKRLWETEPATPEQAEAKDFFFFSYACNGMNIKDIAYLKYEDISGDTLRFKRAKTSSTNTDQAAVVVYLSDFTKSVIEKYGNPNTGHKVNIFNIIDPHSSEKHKHRQLTNFIRTMNQRLKKFAISAKVDQNISSYWARHSFATNAIRSGASMEYVSEALSHSNLNTTRSYFAGFEDAKKREISEKLMDF